MSGASKYQCTCGYQAGSQQDLDEHTAAMAPLAPEGEHQQKVRLYQAKRPPAPDHLEAGGHFFATKSGTSRPEPVIVLVERRSAGAPWQVDPLVTA